MQKVHNADQKLVCMIDDYGRIIIKVNSNVTIIAPEKPMNYIITLKKEIKIKKLS